MKLATFRVFVLTLNTITLKELTINFCCNLIGTAKKVGCKTAPSEAWVKFFSHKTNFSDLDSAARFPRKAAPRFTHLGLFWSRDWVGRWMRCEAVRRMDQNQSYLQRNGVRFGRVWKLTPNPPTIWYWGPRRFGVKPFVFGGRAMNLKSSA